MSKIAISNLTESLNKDQIVNISSGNLSAIKGGGTVTVCVTVITENEVSTTCTKHETK